MNGLSLFLLIYQYIENVIYTINIYILKNPIYYFVYLISQIYESTKDHLKVTANFFYLVKESKNRFFYNSYVTFNFIKGNLHIDLVKFYSILTVHFCKKPHSECTRQ